MYLIIAVHTESTADLSATRRNVDVDDAAVGAERPENTATLSRSGDSAATNGLVIKLHVYSNNLIYNRRQPRDAD